MIEREKFKTVFHLYTKILGTVFTEKVTNFTSHGDILDYPFRFVLNLPKLNVYSEHNEALKVLLTYFSTAKSYTEIETTSHYLLKSSELARRAILRKRLNIDFLTPSKFLKKGRLSLANVVSKWLPDYLKREKAVSEKIKQDQGTIKQLQQKAKFQYEADLLLNEILENKASITKGLRYINQQYTQTFRNWFAELVQDCTSGNYTPTAKPKNQKQKEFVQKVFHCDEYILENEKQLLNKLEKKRKRIYFRDLHEFILFKDQQNRTKPLGIKNHQRFEEIAYKHLLFN